MSAREPRRDAEGPRWNQFSQLPLPALVLLVAFLTPVLPLVGLVIAALVAGLVNCHAHLGATLARGFNEDFGFPNSARLAVQPNSLLQGEEATLMVTWEALPEDVARFIHAHPTQNESLGEAALALAGQPLHAHA